MGKYILYKEIPGKKPSSIDITAVIDIIIFIILVGKTGAYRPWIKYFITNGWSNVNDSVSAELQAESPAKGKTFFCKSFYPFQFRMACFLCYTLVEKNTKEY